MSLINISAIDNLCSDYTASLRSFHVASVLVSNEEKESYEWVLSQLRDEMSSGDCMLKLFINDNDKVTGHAITTIFPGTPRILCAWHVEMNFYAELYPVFPKDSKPCETMKKKIRFLVYFARDIDAFEKCYNEIQHELAVTREW